MCRECGSEQQHVEDYDHWRVRPVERLAVSVGPRQKKVVIQGATVVVRNDDGWVHLEVKTDSDVKGWAITVNGKDLP